MSKSGRMIVTETIDVDCDVTIYADDVIEFIKHHATDSDLQKISNHVRGIESKSLKTLVDVMKYQLMLKAMNKYSLEELESRLEMDYL